MTTPWFKFLPRQYAETLVSEGTVKISRLDWFWNTEKLGSAIGDDGEGTLTIYSHDPGTHVGPNPFEAQFVKGLENATFTNNRFEQQFVTRDHFVFSCSTSDDRAILHRLNAEIAAEDEGVENYNACVRIHDRHAFRRSLQDHLRLYDPVMEFVGWGDCVYIGREHPWDRPRHIGSYFMKPSRYSWQREARLIFKCRTDEEIPYIITSVPELTKYVSMEYAVND